MANQWFDNLIKTNKARQKAGEVYTGPVALGDHFVDGREITASRVGAKKAAHSPIVESRRGQNGPLSALEFDRARTLANPTDFLTQARTLPVGMDPKPWHATEELLPARMILQPEVEGEAQRFKDGSRDPIAYAEYLFGDRFSDTQLAAALDYMENPSKPRTATQAEIIRSVIPNPTVNVVAENDPKAKYVPGYLGKEGDELASVHKAQRLWGGVRNLVDNSTTQFRDLRKTILGKKDPREVIITDGDDPQDAKGNKFTLDDIGYFFKMPDGKVYSDVQVNKVKIDDKTGEAIMPDGARYDPKVYNASITEDKVFRGLPDGTELELGKYGLAQEKRGLLSLRANEPKTPLQDAMGRFPGEPGYNLFENFSDAGITEILPFMTDTMLGSLPRMVNPYAAAGLALNDMWKGARSIDNETMEASDSLGGWNLFGAPTFEAKSVTPGQQAINTIMPAVEAGTEYMLPVATKALGKMGSKTAIKSVGGDFVSTAIERLVSGTKGKVLAGAITEGPIEEGTTQGMQSLLNYFLDPNDWGVRNQNVPPTSRREKLIKELNDIGTASFAGALMGGAMNARPGAPKTMSVAEPKDSESKIPESLKKQYTEERDR